MIKKKIRELRIVRGSHDWQRCVEGRKYGAGGLYVVDQQVGRECLTRFVLWGQRINFFFQAEDGIRDYKVTGVQTCALPISMPAKRELGRTVRHLAQSLCRH